MGRLVLCAAAVLVCVVGGVASTASTDFNIKPDGQTRTVEATKDGFVCKFEYAAFGGTNEDWTIAIETDGDMSACRIERPKQASYLFFTGFKVSAEGRDIDLVEVYGNGPAALAADTVSIAGNQVASTASFNGELARVFLLVKSPPPPAGESVPPATGKPAASPPKKSGARASRPKAKPTAKPGAEKRAKKDEGDL